MAEPLHQVPVTGDHVSIVVNDAVRILVVAFLQHAFGDCHAHSICAALTQGPGRGLDAIGVAALGVTGGEAVPLAEALKVREADFIAREVQQAVNQHGSVSGGENKAVSIGPIRPFGPIA